MSVVDIAGCNVCSPLTASSWKPALRDPETHCTWSSPCASSGSFAALPYFHPSCSYTVSSGSFHYSWLLLIKLADITHTHTHVFYHNWVALWGYPLPCVDENKLALEKTGGLRGFEAFCLLEKWILLWTADHFYPRALSRTSFEKQLYFSDSLANLCLQDCLVFIMVIQVFTKTEGFFFLFFIIQIAENPYEKYICMYAQM